MKCREVQGDNKYENWMEEHGYILQSINWSNVKINWPRNTIEVQRKQSRQIVR